jgi:hypothetical protein
MSRIDVESVCPPGFGRGGWKVDGVGLDGPVPPARIRAVETEARTLDMARLGNLTD